MGLRMKNFNILGDHWGAWTVCRFKWGLGKKEGVDWNHHILIKNGPKRRYIPSKKADLSKVNRNPLSFQEKLNIVPTLVYLNAPDK